MTMPRGPAGSGVAGGGHDPAEEGEELLPFGLVEIGEERLLGPGEAAVQLRQVPATGRREPHHVATPIGRIRFPDHELGGGELVESGNDITAVDPRPTAEVGLAGRTRFVQGGEEGDVVSSGPELGQLVGDEAIGDGGGLVEPPAGLGPHQRR